MTDTKSIINCYKKIGYTEEHHFEGEYTLLINKEISKVRVYEDGHVLITDPVTGEYMRVQ